MKKILYITLLLFTCVSCDEWIDDYNKNFEKREQKIRQNRIEEHINDTTDLQDNLYNLYNLYNVKFDGHLYVVYTKKNGGYGFGAAMVHSPNCECHKEKLNNEKNN